MNKHLRKIDIDRDLYFADRLLVCAKNLERNDTYFFGVLCSNVLVYTMQMWCKFKHQLQDSSEHKQLIGILSKTFGFRYLMITLQ